MVCSITTQAVVGGCVRSGVLKGGQVVLGSPSPSVSEGLLIFGGGGQLDVQYARNVK